MIPELYKADIFSGVYLSKHNFNRLILKELNVSDIFVPKCRRISEMIITKQVVVAWIDLIVFQKCLAKLILR